MSEYQYYEFQAIDRMLTAAQQAAVRKLSSRVELSASRAAFNYSYGDFPGDSLEVLEQHFDMMLYIANWGSKQLAFRFPKGSIEAAKLDPYLLSDQESYKAELEAAPQYFILNLEISDEEGYGWIEGEGLLDPLIPLREAILRGDLRVLYIFWLYCAEQRSNWDDGDEVAEALTEPPVPPGLGQLDQALRAFVEFFEIDEDLIAAAAEGSPPFKASKEPLERWITLLPDAERNAFLLRVAQGESQVGGDLLRRLRELGGSSRPAAQEAGPRRTFADLQAAAKQQQKLRKQRERNEAEQARLAKLDFLAKRETYLWDNIPPLLAKRNASGYDEGVALLADLRDLALYRGQADAFEARLAKITAPYAGSQALQRRLREKQLR